MEMLDAALALVITLAALATTVTVLMEIWVRFFGLKSKTQIDLFTRIFDDAVSEKFAGAPNRNDFLRNVLANPLHDFSAMKKKASALSSKNPGQTEQDVKPATVPLGLQGKGIYEWVSHEHVYRSLLKTEGIIEETRNEMIARLKDFTLKYDEYCAAASLQFKDNRQRWSIIGGLLLSIAINADGMRIYNEFLKNPELAAAVSSRIDELERASVLAEQKLQAALDGDQKGELLKFQESAKDMSAKLSDLETTGVPIGWSFPPHCQMIDLGRGWMQGVGNSTQETAEKGEGKTTSTCRLASDQGGSTLALAGSFLAMIGTGFLIGLGAPFWFDVARRLAHVRSAFGASAGGDAPYSGESPDDRMPPASRAEAKTKLITRVVDEVLGGNPEGRSRRLLNEEIES